MSLNLTDDEVDTGSGNGLVLSSNKPLPEPMLAQIYVAIWYTMPQWVNYIGNRG